MVKGISQDLKLIAPFIGTWELVSCLHRLADGTTIYPLGENAQGILIYTKEGFMSGALMQPSRPPFATKELFSGTIEEKSNAASGYLHYAGHFEVSPEEVRHQVTLSLFPNWLGTFQRRKYRFSTDQQTLELYTGSFIADGIRQTAHLNWKRLPTIYSVS